MTRPWTWILSILTPTNILGTAIGVIGFVRVFTVESKEKFDQTTLMWFVASMAVFLVSRAKTFKYGELELELREAKEAAEEAAKVANIASDSVALQTPKSPDPTPRMMAVPELQPGSVADDPWKGVFGGKSMDGKAGRRLTASVTPLKSFEGWYAVALAAQSTPGSEPLSGEVQFFIHDSFPNQCPVVVARKGTAQLHLRAWGAFTVGVLCDNGATRLELDLAELPDAPMEFRTR